jgi:hypothetical protein
VTAAGETRLIVTQFEVDEAHLRELYEQQQMSIRRIAGELGIGERPVRRLLGVYGIAVRSPGRVGPSKPRPAPRASRWVSETVLQDL